jgi:hypothetical protein
LIACPPAVLAKGSAAPPRFESSVGVRHISRIASVRLVTGCITPVVVEDRAEARESATAAVGHDEESIPSMGRPNSGRTAQTPFRIEPEVGQVSENKGQSPSRNKGRHVFQPDEPRVHFANAVDDVGPDPADVVGAFAAAGGTPRLTGESGSDAIHASTPASTVEGSKVSPDRRRSQDAFFHARDQNAGGMGFPLQVSNNPCCRYSEFKPEFESSDPSTERDDVKFGTYSHIRQPDYLSMNYRACTRARRSPSYGDHRDSEEQRDLVRAVVVDRSTRTVDQTGRRCRPTLEASTTRPIRIGPHDAVPSSPCHVLGTRPYTHRPSTG